MKLCFAYVVLMENSSEQKALATYLLEKRSYTQLITQYTTDYRTQIDHIYTNILNHVQTAGVLESYYSDHKPRDPNGAAPQNTRSSSIFSACWQNLYMSICFLAFR